MPFGFFEAIFGIFPFRLFVNGPLSTANPAKKSARKFHSNSLEIKFKRLLNFFESL